ncbi:MAG: C-GCAxxG-C-C family protein [Candidatus Thorarchaeota archaeon]
MSTTRVEKAKKIIDEQRGSCSQAIFTTYGEFLSSGSLDYKTCMNLASGFGGGIASNGNVCGALTGAIMALGLKYGGSMMEEKVFQAANTLLENFTKLNGSVLCRELINYDLASAEGVKEAFEKGVFKNCPKYVEDVAKILETLI